MRNKISSWVRQARHRAKRYDCISRLELADLTALLTEYNSLCAYCDEKAVTMDHAFPLSDKAPNVLANCLPACRGCKEKKKNGDLVVYQKEGHISEERMLSLIKQMLERDGCDLVRDHIRNITGIGASE